MYAVNRLRRSLCDLVLLDVHVVDVVHARSQKSRGHRWESGKNTQTARFYRLEMKEVTQVPIP